LEISEKRKGNKTMMVRQIKFRAWDKVSRRYYYNPIKRLEPTSNAIEVDLNMAIRSLAGEKMVFEQFTGLKDQTGTEIYEGDIVEHWIYSEWQRAEVKFIRGAFHLSDPDGNEKKQAIWKYAPYDLRVQGNIHEDYKLLEPEPVDLVVSPKRVKKLKEVLRVGEELLALIEKESRDVSDGK
jgi:hypothetical protein